MYDKQNERGRPFYKTDLGVSIRKVTNGFSIKINATERPDDLGKVMIATDTDELLNQLRGILNDYEDSNDKEAEGTEL